MKSLATRITSSAGLGPAIGPFVNALVNAPAYYTSEPTCRIDNAAINGDIQITNADVPGFIALLGL